MKGPTLPLSNPQKLANHGDSTPLYHERTARVPLDTGNLTSVSRGSSLNRTPVVLTAFLMEMDLPEPNPVFVQLRLVCRLLVREGTLGPGYF